MCFFPNVTNPSAAPCESWNGFHTTPYTCGGSPLNPGPSPSSRPVRQWKTCTVCALSMPTAASFWPSGEKPSATTPRTSRGRRRRATSASPSCEPTRESQTQT